MDKGQDTRMILRPLSLIKVITGLTIVLCTFLLVRSYQPTLLEQVKAQGELHVVSRNGPTTYYETPNGYSGFEYELLKGFADELGVELVIRDERRIDDMLYQISTRANHHLAAAGIVVTPKRSERVLFSQPFMDIHQQVIYNTRKPAPKKLEDLVGRDLVVSNKAAHLDRLEELKETWPDLTWREVPGAEMFDLLEMVHKGDADLAIIDSNIFELHRYVYPRAKVALNISEPQHLAWAFQNTLDRSLYDAAEEYLQRVQHDGTLQRITENFYRPPPIEEVTTADALMFTYRLTERFPQWENHLKEAAEDFELDWKLLAAISYQESHWDPKAVSPTGVRGLMMLTRAAASEVGVNDRVDPKQSIFGGAQYLKNLLARIPARVTNEEDRLYMALAAYNVGLGHLEDARVLTEKNGDDPNKWDDVRKYLPLLSKRQYYTKTRHGYARGWEPVAYVKKVRNYHKIMAWHAEQEERRLAVAQHDNRSPEEKARDASGNVLSRNALDPNFPIL